MQSKRSTWISYNSQNRRVGFSYDAAGNLTNDLGQTFTYDATGQQATASYGGYSLQQSYDCDGLRVKKTENGVSTYYLRSTVFGGQVVAEIKWFSVAWGWDRGYVYSGSGLLSFCQMLCMDHQVAILVSPSCRPSLNVTSSITSAAARDLSGCATSVLPSSST